jgi:circadian clock protein KaiB
MPSESEYDLVLFIVGTSPRSATALKNIQEICTQHLAGRHTLAVVDVERQPERAVEEDLLGLPCLIKKRPGLVRRMVGDLSDRNRALALLGLS